MDAQSFKQIIAKIKHYFENVVPNKKATITQRISDIEKTIQQKYI